jgi:hypothetical protein
MAPSLAPSVRTATSPAPLTGGPLATPFAYHAAFEPRSSQSNGIVLAHQTRWLDTFASETAPVRTSQAARVRDRYFEWLGADPDPALVPESRWGPVDDGESRMAGTWDLSDLLAEVLDQADPASQVEDAPAEPATSKPEA